MRIVFMTIIRYDKSLFDSLLKQQMEFRPDWKSKILVRLLGKRKVMTLLDTGQLMFKDDFKANPSFKFISNQIFYSAITANVTAIFTAILLSRTVFKKNNLFSLLKLATDCSIVILSYYAAAVYLSQTLRIVVQQSKSAYLKRYDEDFLFHFNFIAAKYQIEDKMQVENIFTDKELEQWMNELYKKTSQINQ